MKEEFISLPLNQNKNTNRFEIEVNELIAFIDFKERGNKIYLIHTEVPEDLEGRGVATALIEKTLGHIEENGYKLVALCPLVVAYIRRHPEWKRILDIQNDII